MGGRGGAKGRGGIPAWLPSVAATVSGRPDAAHLKLKKLSKGPFAFFRGTLTAYVARVQPDLARRPPQLPGLLLGDLHLENFGAWRSASGRVCFDLDDFDEATFGDAWVDLRRLLASAWLVGGKAAAEATLAGLADPASPRIPAVVTQQLEATAAASEQRFVEKHLQGPHRLAASDRLAPLEGERAARLLRELSSQGLTARALACRLAGNGSLGRRRYLALTESSEGLRLLDLKEALRSPWGGPASLLGARSRAEQVVRLARAFRKEVEPGLRTWRLHGRAFQAKRLGVQGKKLDAAELTATELKGYARWCGGAAREALTRAGHAPERLLAAASGAEGKRLLAESADDAAWSEEGHAWLAEHLDEVADQLGCGAEGSTRSE